jgi:hypothetical protein
MRIARLIGLIAAGVLLSACLLILLGAHFYNIPVISSIGSMLLSIFGPWLIAMPLGAGVFAARVWRASHWRSALVLMIAAAVAAAWGAAAVSRMVFEARHHGVRINLVRAFALRILPGSHPDEDLIYGTWKDQPLHVIVYKPIETTRRQAAPVLLYLHGGGFSFGDRFESGTNLRWFADRGWLVLSIDYTLSSADRHLWDTSTSQVGAQWRGPRRMPRGLAAIPLACPWWDPPRVATSLSMPLTLPTQAGSNPPAVELCHELRR